MVKMLSVNKNKVYNYIPMTIEDENIDQMVKLIRYEPLENFFTRHPSLDDYKDLLRSSQSENVKTEESEGNSARDSDELKEEFDQQEGEVDNEAAEEEDDDDNVFHSDTDNADSLVCHHSDCQDKNNHRPLMLCDDCDTQIHNQPENSGHLRFEVIAKKGGSGGALNRLTSTRSLPGMVNQEAASDEESTADKHGSNPAGELRTPTPDLLDVPDRLAPPPPTRDSRPPGPEEGTDGIDGRLIQNGLKPPIPSSRKDLDQTTTQGEIDHDLAKKNAKLKRKKVMKRRANTDVRELGGKGTIGSAQHPRSKSLPEKEFIDLATVNQNQNQQTNGHWVHHSSSASMDGGSIVRESPTLLQMSLSRESDNSEVSVFDDSSATSPDVMDKNNEDNLYSPEEREYSKLKKVRELEVAVDASTPVQRRPRSPRRQAHSTSKFYTQENFSNHHLAGVTRKISVPARHHLPKSEKERVRKYSLGNEYFTLKFDMLPEDKDLEIVAATKGVRLGDAIQFALEKRHILLDKVNVFVAQSKTPLPLQAECSFLGGSHVHVRAKEGESPFVKPGSTVGTSNRASIVSTSSIGGTAQKRNEKTKPSSQKGNKHRTSTVLAPSLDDASLNDTSPHNTLTERDVQRIKMSKSKSKISDLFSPFVKGGESSEKQDQLTELLNGYSTNGLPSLDSIVHVGVESYEEDTFHMEKHWSEIVDNAEGLSKKQRNQQTRIWELLHTEVEYIQKLKVIIDLFMCVLLNLQKEILLNDIETDRVFSNITAVYNANCVFWADYMSAMLKHTRKTREPLNPSYLKEGFSKFEDMFKPYTKYCFEQKPCQEYIKQRYRDNDLFRIYVAWAETQKQCNRLKLADLLVTPMHRLTRYKLLLAAIHKETTDEVQKKDVLHMIEKVERFVLQVNTYMHQEQERARLSRIIDRIEDYQAVEVPNDECAKLIRDLNKLDLTCPVPGCGPHQKRHLLKECSFRLKETTGGKSEVHCFLFTDLLLITKQNTKKGNDKVKVIKPPMRLDKIIVQPLNDQMSFLLVHLNEYHLASAAYTLHGDNAKVYIEEIRRAQDAYRDMRKAAMDRSESRIVYLSMLEDDDEYSADFNITGQHSDHSPDHTLVHRIDSNSSVDTFMPNLSMGVMPRSSSQDTLHRASMSDPYNLDRQHSLDSGQNTPKRPRSATLGTFTGRGSPRNLSISHSVEGSIDETEYLSPSTSPGANEINLAEDMAVLGVKPKTKYIIRTDSQSSGESSGSNSHAVIVGPHRQIEVLPNRLDMSNLDENVKAKLQTHRRKTSGNRRYHTADAIQELRKDSKDASIHKRLSWNLGTVDISIDGERQGILKHKTFSNDSLRSMPSSSGVSSTGSLHLSPESEICEEYETPEQEISHTSSSDYHIVPEHTQQVLSNHTATMIMTQSFNEADVLLQVGNHSDGTQMSQEQGRTMSKSLPDLSAMMKGGDVRDGIGSVALPNPEQTAASQTGQRRKMTQAQIWKMTALLLNSTLEASEV